MFFVSLRLGWEVNSAWLITELANQRARKALFTCEVYNVMYTPRRRWKGFSELATTTKPVGILNLKLFYILMQIKFIYTRKVSHLAFFWTESFCNSEMTYCWERRERWTASHKEHRGMNLRLRFVVLLHLARVFDHFVVLKLLLWITRQRSLEYLVY